MILRENGIPDLCCVGLLKMDLHVYVYVQRKTFWEGKPQNALCDYLCTVKLWETIFLPFI